MQKGTSRRPLTPEVLLADETQLAVANGYIEVRGNLEEGCEGSMPTLRATYIDGFYEEMPRTYESPKGSKVRVNVMDAQTIHLWVNGQRFSMFSGKVKAYDRWIDVTRGLQIRTVLWQSPKGDTVAIEIKRMASFERRELLTIDYTVKAVDFDGTLRIESSIEGNFSNERLYAVTHKGAQNDRIIMTAKTVRSAMKVTVAAAHNLPMDHFVGDGNVRSLWERSVKAGDEIRLIKYVVYTDSFRHGHTESVAEAYLNEVCDHGLEQWYHAQRDYLSRFWKFTRVEIFGDIIREEAVNRSCYQFYTAGDKEDDSTGVASQVDVAQAYAYYLQRRKPSANSRDDSMALSDDYLSFIFGTGGVSVIDGHLHLTPKLPKGWQGYRYRFRHKGVQLTVTVTDDVTVSASSKIGLFINERIHEVKDSVILALNR